RENLYFQGKDG
nr:Chain C, peptide RENLYFQGKDG [Potyviridae]5AUM_D Chain D, peptide RENLYFQGKDG [Potyviridae]